MSPLLLAVLMAQWGESPRMEQWLESDPAQATRPQAVKLYLMEGDGRGRGRPVAVRQAERFTRFELVSQEGRRSIRPSLKEDHDALGVVAPQPTERGALLFVLDTAPQVVELGAEAYQQRLLESRQVQALAGRAELSQEGQPGRERFTRHMKALVSMGPGAVDGVTRPVGQELELVPTTNPAQAKVGDTLVVQVLFKGKPLAKGAVDVVSRHRGNVAIERLRADPEGKASVSIQRRGDMLLRAVHVEPAEGEIAWRGYWATFTFALGEEN